MSLKEVSNLLLNATRALDVFGDVSEEDVKKKYKSFVKICHPDLVKDNEKKLAESSIKLLNEYYKKALEEIKKNIYNITDEKELLELNEALFEFKVKKDSYKFYKYYSSDDICDIYEGIINDDKIVFLRIVMDESDNELLTNEYELLNELNHVSILKPKSKVKINGKIALVFEKQNIFNIKEFKQKYGNMDAYHVCWVLERLLSVLGYLHSNKIVHGNIKEENILIDPDNHNVILLDYSLCIKDADSTNSKYKIINDYYSPSYVDSTAKVKPNTDIYAISKIAINLLGGDIDNVALPISCDVRVRSFIRKMLNEKENDAWKLWDELIQLRKEVYGTKKFQVLKRKLK